MTNCSYCDLDIGNEQKICFDCSLVGTPLEGEHLHPYTLDPTLEDKYHGKEQIYTRAKDPDCTGIDQSQHARQNCAASTIFTHRRFITGNRDSWSPAKQA